MRTPPLLLCSLMLLSGVGSGFAEPLPAVETARAEREIIEFVREPESVDDWSPIVTEALKQLPEGGSLTFPGGRTYPIGSPVELHRSVSFRFGPSATLSGTTSLFSIREGKQFVFEGTDGTARLETAGKQGAVIDLRSLNPGAAPDLTVRRLGLRGNLGISGNPASRYNAEAGGLGTFHVESCRFEAKQTAIAFNQASVRRLRVRDSDFSGGARKGIWVPCPIEEGAFVTGNRLIDIGLTAIQLGGGKAGQIDDGALDWISGVTVHENQILGGGKAADETVAYIFGILVYGTNVSIQGNIVRDFNRGEPVPGERIGHHFKMADGSWHRGPWVYPDNRPRRRLAGAAIYAKAQYGIIANNVCTRSGWRSVIEVKTGGRRPYFMVSTNMVDGSSLAIDDSFGFEADTARALWSQNLVVNMPHEAFKSMAGWGSNTFEGNVIVDSKIGFSLYSDNGNAERTRVANTRFVNVEQPIRYANPKGVALNVAAPTPISVPNRAALPAATEAEHGRIALVRSDPDELLIVRKTADGYAWVRLDPPAAPSSETP